MMKTEDLLISVSSVAAMNPLLLLGRTLRR